jgi:acyl-CoA thioesterase FadM
MILNLYLRLLIVWLRNFTVARRHYSQGTQSRFRVLPHDLDAFGHMNNGRYLQIMDVARVEWMLQTRIAATIRKNSWSPLLGGGLIRYRHSLKLMQVYRVHTHLLGWDRRWFFLEHSFKDSRGRCVAVGVTRAGLRTRESWVHTTDVANSVHPGATSPQLPAHISDWTALEEKIYREGAGRPPLQTQQSSLSEASQ